MPSWTMPYDYDNIWYWDLIIFITVGSMIIELRGFELNIQEFFDASQIYA